METYLRDLAKVLGVGAGFAAIPLFASFAALQPPWPPAIGYVSAALVLVSALLAWEWTRKSRLVHRRRWIVSGVGLTLVGLVVYLVLYSLFVENIPGSDDRVVRGFTCTADAQLIYRDRCPDLPREALQDAEWEAVAIWTRSSVTAARVSLACAWILFTAGLVAAVGSVVAGRKLGGTARRTRASEKNVPE